MFSIPDITDIIGQILINNNIYAPDNTGTGMLQLITKLIRLLPQTIL